ncbi:MAG: BatD family protein [Armatimonadota bacterium]
MSALRQRAAVAAVVVLGVLLVAPAAAQVDVQASLNRETVEVGETVELTVVVTGAVLGIDAPRIPQIDSLPVTSTASSTNIEFVGGDMQRTTVFSYELRAGREGTYTIPPLSVPVGDDTYTTPALSLRVHSATGTSPPPPSQPQFDIDDEPTDQPTEPVREIDAVTEVDDRTPWVGEQVTLTLKFLQAHTLRLMGNVEYEPPSTEGLVAEPLPDEAQRTQVIDGVRYEVATRKTSLIAPAPGEYTIGPATITFRRSFMQGSETLETEPITLNVRPLPRAGRPADFSGAVGSIQLETSLSATEVQVGEAVPLRLEMTGTGDLRQIEPPEVSVEGDARVYQSGEDREIGPQPTADGYQIGGRVAFDYLIMPRSPGELRIKPIVMHYFEPEVERYQSARTSAATVSVLPGEAGETTAPSAGEELRYISESGLAVRSSAPVTSHAWFWALQALPLLGLGWALRERSERLRRERDPRYRRRVEAARKARRALGAVDPASEAADVYHRVDEVIAEYIAARTGGAAAAISPETAYERLIEEGADPERAGHARDLLRRVRAGAYAPGASEAPDPAEAIAQARALVDALEGELR